MTKEERQEAIEAMAQAIGWSSGPDDSQRDDAEGAMAGLEQFMDEQGFVFYKP